MVHLKSLIHLPHFFKLRENFDFKDFKRVYICSLPNTIAILTKRIELKHQKNRVQITCDYSPLSWCVNNGLAILFLLIQSAWLLFLSIHLPGFLAEFIYYIL